MKCYKCESASIVKNGHDKNGKQKYFCKDCKSILTENVRPIFSNQEKARIKSFFGQNLTIKDIACIFNRTDKSIYAILDRLNLQRSLNK